MKSDIVAIDIFRALKDKDMLPSIPVRAKALNIYLVISHNSCSAWQIFSCWRRLKIYLRCRMSQCLLSSLALLHLEHKFINGVIFKNIGNIIDVLSQGKGRESYFVSICM